MTKAKDDLKKEINTLNDERIIEKLLIFVLGIKTQQGIETTKQETKSKR